MSADCCIVLSNKYNRDRLFMDMFFHDVLHCWRDNVSLCPPRIRPSVSCGPFRFFPNMWSVVPTSFYNLSETTQEFLFFIGSQSFSIPLFALSWWVNLFFLQDYYFGINSTVFNPKCWFRPIIYMQTMWSFIFHFMKFNPVSFLPDSVVMCYFIALASVYGNSVALLRTQLKLVSN